MSYHRDANAKSIQEALRTFGYHFEILDSVGNGFPDAAVIAPDGTIALVEIKNPGRMTKPPFYGEYAFNTWSNIDAYERAECLDQIAEDVFAHDGYDYADEMKFRTYLFDHLDDRKQDGAEHDWHRLHNSASVPDPTRLNYKNPRIFIAWSAWSIVYQMEMIK